MNPASDSAGLSSQQTVTLRLGGGEEGEEEREKSFCSHFLFIRAPGCYAKQHLALNFMTEAPQRCADSALLQVQSVDAATHWENKTKKRVRV